MSKTHSTGKQLNKKAEIPKQHKTILSPKFVLAAILLLIFCIYSNSLHNAILTFDDNEYFSNYPEVLHLTWKSVCDYFTHYYVIMYQPLPVLTFAINYHFSAFNTFPMHLVNLLFHLINTVLVFQFVSLLTKNKNIALLVTLFFGIHPMNVEAVSWISARSSSLYTFFYLLALIYYLKYITQNFKTKHLIVTTAFFILSLFSKAQAVTLPVVMLLLDYFFGRKLLSQRIILEKIPFLILSIVFGIVTLHDSGTMYNITKGMLIHYSPVDVFFIVCHSFIFYLFKFFIPIDLCSIYLFPLKNDSMLPFVYYASAVILIVISIILFRLRKSKQVILGTGLFLITIAINIQIIPSRLFEVTDRYAYFPYIGLYLLVFVSLNTFKEKNKFLFEKFKPVLITFLFFYIIFFSCTVYSRNNVWKNDETLMTDIIQKNPPTEYIRRAYGNRGLYYKNQNRFSEAIADFTQTIQLKHNDPIAYYNRGITYFGMNNNAEALSDFDEAIKLNLNRSDLYSNRAKLRLMFKDTTGAVADCEKSIRIDSTYVDAYNTLATIQFNKKEYDQCERNLTIAITHKPDFDLAYKNRGLLYLQTGKNKQACIDLQQAVNLGNAEAVQFQQQYCK